MVNRQVNKQINGQVNEYVNKQINMRNIYYILGIIAIILLILYIEKNYNSPAPIETNGLSHPNMYLNSDEILIIKQKIANNEQPWKFAYDNMINDNDKWLNMPIQSVIFGGNTSPSEDIHDYNTDAPYIADGISGPDVDRADYTAVLNMSRTVRNLGLAYALTGKDIYAERAIILINAWTIDPDTKMNPKFTNSQSFIEISASIPAMFYGADLIWNYPGWNQTDKDAFRQWVVQIVESAKGWDRDNNFENWRLVFISSGSVIIEDADGRKYAFDRWKSIIPDQVNIDGSMKQELTRTNSLTYSTYALNGMLQTAEIARHYGVDLYNYKLLDGRGLEKALDFHAPYIVNSSNWTYKQISQYKGDNSAIYELAYSFKQKSSYYDVINRWKRPMYEMRVMGQTTLTHANSNFVLSGSKEYGSGIEKD